MNRQLANFRIGVNKGVLLLLLFVVIHLPLSGQSYYPVKVNNLWGMIDAEGNLAVRPQYDVISNFEQFNYATVQKSGKVGIVNNFGKQVLPVAFSDIKVIDSLLFSIKDDKGWLLIDNNQQVLIGTYYQDIQRLKPNVFAVKNENGWGIQQLDQGLILEPQFEAIQAIGEDLFLASENGRKGIVSQNGHLIVPAEYDEILLLKDGLFLVRKNSHWGILSEKGNILSPVKYRSFDFLTDHFIKLYSFEELHLFSIPCQRVIAKERVGNFLPFSRNNVLVKKQRKMGVIDFCGNQVLAERYDEVLWFKEGLYRVNLNGRWGLVKAKDQIFTPLDYAYISPLRQKLALVSKEGQFGLLNHEGEQVIRPLYKRIELEGKTAKAYREQGEGKEETLDLLKFDAQGKLVADSRFEKHFSVRVGKKNNSLSVESENPSSYILQDFEWFYDSESDRWGLRKINDGSLKISASFEQIKVHPDLGITIVGLGSNDDFEWERTTIRATKIFGVVDNQNGVLLGKMQYRHIFLEDFRNGQAYARCILKDGTYALINKEGQLLDKTYTYIGPFKDGIARSARGGTLNASMNPEFPIVGLYPYLINWESPYVLIDDTTYDELLLRKGKVYCKDCSWSYIDTEGEAVGKESFDYMIDMVNEVGMVYRNEKWGLAGKNGQLILPCAYDNLSFLENTDNRILKLYIRKTQYGLIDTLGKLTINAMFDEVGSIREARLAVMQNGRWGFADQNGDLVIPCRYDEVRSFHNGLAAVRIGRNWGFIDRKGRLSIPLQYRKSGDFSDGMAWVEKDGKVGYIDQTGAFRIPPKYSEGRTFYEGVAIIKKEDLYGIIDSTGEYLVKPRYHSIRDFDDNGLAIVEYGKTVDRFGVINKTGTLVTSVAYREIGDFSEGLALVKDKDVFGYINTRGQLVIPCQFAKASPFSEGRAAVFKNGDCGYIARSGKNITDYKFSRCQDFDDGRAVVYRGMRKAGLVDREGNLILVPSVNRLLKFSEGRGLVRDHEYRFYFITEEADIYQGYYEKAKEFQNGIAVIRMNEKWGVINRNGITLVRPKYSRIEAFKDGYAKVEIDGFSGLSDISGQVIVQPGFEYISYAGDGLFRVEQGDKIGYFDQEGEWVWELQN